MDGPRSMQQAQALTERGKHREAVNVLKLGVEQSDELDDRMFCAGTLVSIIIHDIHGGENPPPGTSDYEDCRKYAAISLECFEQADVVTRSGFHDLAEDLRTTLNQLERGASQADGRRPSRKKGCVSSAALIVLLCLVVSALLWYLL